MSALRRKFLGQPSHSEVEKVLRERIAQLELDKLGLDMDLAQQKREVADLRKDNILLRKDLDELQAEKERDELRKYRDQLKATMQTAREAVLLEAVSLLNNSGCLHMGSARFNGIQDDDIVITLRSVIFAKLLDSSIKYPKDPNIMIDPPTLPEGSRCHSENLYELQGMDSPLSLELARQIIGHMPSASTVQTLLCFRTCQRCQKSRISAGSFRAPPPPLLEKNLGFDMSAFKWMNEYSQLNFFDCRKGDYCTECIVKHFSRQFENYELVSLYWAKTISIQCFCGRLHDEDWFTEAFSRSWVRNTRHRNCMDSEWGRLMKTWTMMQSIRAALGKMKPQPSERAAFKSYCFNAELSRNKKAFRYYDPALLDDLPYNFERQGFDSWGWGKDALWRTDGAGEVRYIEIWSGTSSALSIPLFLDFIKRESVPRTCSVCLEDIFEIDYTSPKEWEKSVEQFKGAWMWKILKFPTTFEQECDHALEICRECTEKHIATQLEEKGCNAISCPHCKRLLSPREFKLLAKPETVKRFDELQLRN